MYVLRTASWLRILLTQREQHHLWRGANAHYGLHKQGITGWISKTVQCWPNSISTEANDEHPIDLKIGKHSLP